MNYQNLQDPPHTPKKIKISPYFSLLFQSAARNLTFSFPRVRAYNTTDIDMKLLSIVLSLYSIQASVFSFSPLLQDSVFSLHVFVKLGLECLVLSYRI